MSARPVAASILLTGGTGFLGRLTAGRLLAEGAGRLVLPVRGQHSPRAVLAAIRDEMAAAGTTLDDAALARIVVVPLPAIARTEDLLPVARAHRVEEIVHLGASLDYFDAALADEVNVDWTRRLAEVALTSGVHRFIYVSTAFSCGMVSGPVGERLHGEPPEDLTVYTRSKRAAEHVVAGAGVPFLIIRPSIVIGHSGTGHYTGRNYGLYQLWAGAMRFLTGDYHSVIHAVAPRIESHVVHSDAYLEGFMAAYHLLEDGALFNLISDPRLVPTVGSLVRAWIEEHLRPREIVLYERIAQVPLAKLPAAQRLMVDYVSVNLELMGHRFRFEHGHLDQLKAGGLAFPDANLVTARICERAFCLKSDRLARYRERFRAHLARETLVRHAAA